MGKEENAIQSAIMDYLTYRNIFHYRNNNLAVRGRTFSGMKGVPDIICIIKGRYVGIEVKTETGKQKPEQKQFEKDCINNGGVYCLARCIDDVKEVINDLLR